MTFVALGAGGDRAPTRIDALSALELLFAGFAIMFMTGGLTRLMTGGLPEEVARQTNSPLVQLSGLLVYAGSLAFIALHMRGRAGLIGRNLVLFLPVLLALASTYWSSDPDVTSRRAVALVGTTMLGLYLGLRFGLDEIANLLFASLTIIVGLSFAAAVLAPGFGVHQASDALTAHHAGLWRGLFWHKNSLGPLASLLMLLTLALWARIRRGWQVKLAVVGLCGVVVVKSGSAQAMFQLAVFPLLMLCHRYFGRLAPMTRVAIVGFGLVALVPVIVYHQELQGVALELLGRDPTLSSRTHIWHAALLGGMRHPLLGNGYDVGWFGGANVYALQLYYFDGGHAHNGYLQLWLDLGFVGGALLALVFVIFVLRIALVSKVSQEAYVLLLYFLLYYVSANLITSTLMVYQNIYWLLFATLFVLSSKLAAQAPSPGADVRA